MHTRSAPVQIDPLHDIVLNEGKFSGSAGTTAGDLNDAFVNFDKSNQSGHLCVFFHGGLVSEAEGLNTASRLIENYAANGAYPFFFIWKSDLLSVVRAILEAHSDNPVFLVAANYAIQMVAHKIAGALDTDPSLKGQRIRTRNAVPMTLKELAVYAQHYDRAWARHGGEQLACSSSELKQFAQFLVDAEKAISVKRRLFLRKNLRDSKSPLSRIIHRFNTHHDHDLYTTVVEELFIAMGLDQCLGEKIWGKMKEFINDSFSRGAGAGGSAFLDHLCAAWKKNPGLRVTLIGHSAGAIYVQRFIEELHARLPASSTLQVEFIMLAPALTFERMNAGLPALQKRVSGLRVFGLDNKTEGSYWEVPPVYNKSLLYIVSSLCEADPNADKPLVGMQRYWNGAPYIVTEILAVTAFIDSTRSVWSPANPGADAGYQSNAKMHGRFPVEKDTNGSVCFALKDGF